MSRDLDARAVSARLGELRTIYVPEGLEDAARRLAREQRREDVPFERAVSGRLAELRALDDLSRHLAAHSRG